MGIKEFFSAADKQLHIKASGIVALGTLAIGLIAMWLTLTLGLHPLAVLVLFAGWACGVAVEGTQWNDNKNAKAAGLPPPHEVSFADCLASAFFPTILAVVLQVLFWLHVLPAWPVAQAPAWFVKFFG
jgi:hypothetical protein